MGHYYEKTKDGDVLPRHYVEMATRPGEMRPTRITDVRRMWGDNRAVVPSVTTVMDVLGKPALQNWKIDRHLESAWQILLDTNKYSFDTSLKYMNEVKRQTEIAMDAAPKAGTDFHNSIELYFNGELDKGHEHYNLCEKVQAEIMEKTGCTSEAIFNTEVSFVDGGYGGQCDLHVSDVHEDWIIDFKTKQTADKFKPRKMVYDEHYMQLSAYSKAIIGDIDRSANVFVCLENDAIDFHEHKKEDLIKGWMMFDCCLELWNLKNRSVK
mgnify:CR=1 FL=1|tara:strand:- start:1217 stop:2017 length:801 start_codon:yes stop_codon:yes gene_type:complete